MDLSRHFRRLVFAQVLLGFVAFCLAEGNPGLLLAAGALAALSRYVVEGPAGRPLPNWVIMLGSLAAAAWLGLELSRGTVQLILAVGHFTIWLQVLQLYAHKVNRDYALVLVLSLLLMVGACVLGVSVLFGLLLAAYCVLALFTLLLFQFKITADQVQEQNRAAAPAQATVDPPPMVVGRGHRGHFRLMTLAIGLACLGIAAAVFLLTPRVRRPQGAGEFMGLLPPPQEGYVQTIHLDGPPPVPTASEPLLYLGVHQQERDLGGAGIVWHLRGGTLDEYDPAAHVWSRSWPLANARDREYTVGSGGRPLGRSSGDEPPIIADLTHRAHLSNALFALNPPVFIDCPGVERVLFNAEDQQLSAAAMFAGVLRYTVHTPPHPTAAVFDNYRFRLESSLFRDGPRAAGPEGDDPLRFWAVQPQRLGDLARRILREAGLDTAGLTPSPVPTSRDNLGEGGVRAASSSDHDKARALADYLRQNYTYSLAAPPVGPDHEPLLDFLFYHRQGHCELFASALTALARTAGLRARIVTGFLAQDYNSIGGYYIVRSQDAHAWTEIWCDREGWVTFDATPPGSGQTPPATGGGPWSFLSRLYEHLEYRWLASVISYDQGSRQSFLAGLTGGVERGPNWLDRTRDFLRQAFREWRFDLLNYALMVLTIFLIGVGLLVLLRLYLVRRRRLAALQLTRLPAGERRRLGRHLGFYLTLLDMLERHGHHRPTWQSPLAFAQTLVREQPERFAPVLALTEHFYEIRFGRRVLDPARKAVIRGHLRRLEQTLAMKAGG